MSNSNEHINLDKSDARSSTIRKSIRRTLNTAAYESIVIEESIEECISWSSLAEREQKENNWTTILISQYKASEKKVLSELGISEKKAHFGSVSETTKQRTPVDANLDALDTLLG